MAFSFDGKKLASGGLDRTVKVWNLDNGKELFTLKEHSFYVISLAFSPDGKTLASASNEVKLWNLETGTEIFNFNIGVNSKVAFSPNGAVLVVRWSKTMRLLDAKNGKELQPLTGNSNFDTNVAFSPDGKIIACGNESQTITLWSAETGQEMTNLSTKPFEIYSIEFSPDSKILTAVSSKIIKEKGYAPQTTDENIINSWDIETGNQLSNIAVKSYFTGEALGVAFSRDVNKMASTLGHEVKIWDVKSGQNIQTLASRSLGVKSAKFSPDGKNIVSIIGNHTINSWSQKGYQEFSSILDDNEQDSRYIYSVDFSLDGRTIVSGNGTGYIRFRDVETGNVLRTIRKENGRLFEACA